MSSIRNRPSAILRRARTQLLAGLGAKITALNADLAAESIPFRLPAFASSQVRIGMQGEELPEHVTGWPSIRLVYFPSTSVPLSAARLASFSARLEVSVHLRWIDLLATDGTSPIAAPASPDAEEEEQLAQALWDYAEAVRLVLCDPSPAVGLLGACGITGVSRLDSSSRIGDFDPSDGRIMGGRISVVFAVEGRGLHHGT